MAGKPASSSLTGQANTLFPGHLWSTGHCDWESGDLGSYPRAVTNYLWVLEQVTDLRQVSAPLISG